MIVAGFGFTTSATAASLRDAYAQTGQQADILATALAKADADCITCLSAELQAPLRAIAPADLSAQTTLTHSDNSTATYNTGSVAEAAALAAAGPGARLLGPRTISADRRATCALAESATP